jgi:hypothetical protein
MPTFMAGRLSLPASRQLLRLVSVLAHQTLFRLQLNCSVHGSLTTIWAFPIFQLTLSARQGQAASHVHLLAPPNPEGPRTLYVRVTPYKRTLWFETDIEWGNSL